LIPDGQEFPFDNAVDKLNRVNYIYALAQSDPYVIALFPYTWRSNSNPNDGPVYNGTKDVPYLLNRYREIGHAIRGY
jgi:hypothetical protein